MIRIVGLGPAGLGRVSAETRQVLLDPNAAVVLRTREHPAAVELARQRRVESCDDLYERAADFDEVYRGIAARVLDRAAAGPVVYAVPGSALVGERAVALIREAAAAAGVQVEVLPGESFLDLAL
jgi:tetrapyrrole methylase family protein/MazG family protein